MTWIKTAPFDEADESLRRAVEAQRGLYPAESATPPASAATTRPRERGRQRFEKQ